MTAALVTTMNLAGFDAYGRRMLHSMRRRLRDDVHLIVYAEGFRPGPGDLPSRHLVLDLDRAAPWLAEFKAWCMQDPARRGMARGAYDFRGDAMRFAHKVAAWTHAALTFDYRVIGWIDADVYAHAPIDAAWLEGLIPPDCALAWLDRKGLYPECGFFLARPRHPAHADIHCELLGLYETRALIQYPETHDSYLMQQVVERAVREGRCRVASLSGKEGFETSHPFINGPLGARLDHLKGPRKQEGRSRPKDVRVKRTEPYWTGAPEQ